MLSGNGGSQEWQTCISRFSSVHLHAPIISLDFTS
jgi:hypothetical protein